MSDLGRASWTWVDAGLRAGTFFADKSTHRPGRDAGPYRFFRIWISHTVKIFGNCYINEATRRGRCVFTSVSIASTTPRRGSPMNRYVCRIEGTGRFFACHKRYLTSYPMNSRCSIGGSPSSISRHGGDSGAAVPRHLMLSRYSLTWGGLPTGNQEISHRRERGDHGVRARHAVPLRVGSLCVLRGEILFCNRPA